MKTRWFFTILATSVLALVSAGMAQQKCNTAMVTGVYAVSCTGSFNLGYPNPVGPFSPFAIQARFLNEVLPDGTPVSNSIGGVLESLGGVQVTTTYHSTAVTINPDCTATVTYHVEEEDLNITFSMLILDEGREVRSFGTQLGLVSTCNSRLMSRNTNQSVPTE